MAGSKKSTPEYRRSRLAARAAQRGTYIDIPHVLDSISELLQEVGESFPNNTSLNSQSYASKMLDQEEVDKYNRLYAIPPPFKLTLVGPGDRTCNWRPSDLCIYKEALMSGIRIPFHEFVIRLLANLRINPCQLVPNAWRVITCFIALCTKKQLPLSVPVFRSIFQFRNSPSNSPGWVFVQHRPGVPNIFNAHSLPENNQRWRHQFMFLHWEGGDWGTLFKSAFARVTDGSNSCHNPSPDDKLIIEQLSCDDGATHYRKIINERALVSLGLSNVSDEGTLFFTLSDFCEPHLFLYRHVCLVLFYSRRIH